MDQVIRLIDLFERLVVLAETNGLVVCLIGLTLLSASVVIEAFVVLLLLIRERQTGSSPVHYHQHAAPTGPDLEQIMSRFEKALDESRGG